MEKKELGDWIIHERLSTSRWVLGNIDGYHNLYKPLMALIIDTGQMTRAALLALIIVYTTITYELFGTK